MKIILARCGNGYAGCSSEEAFIFEDTWDVDEINQEVWLWACENAESFAYVHFGWDEPYTDDDYDDYIENYVDYDWYEASYAEYVEWCENWGYEPKKLEDM